MKSVRISAHDVLACSPHMDRKYMCIMTYSIPLLPIIATNMELGFMVRVKTMEV
jgi:hypothetical protein